MSCVVLIAIVEVRTYASRNPFVVCRNCSIMSTNLPEVPQRPLTVSSASSASSDSPPLPRRSIFQSLSRKKMLFKAAQARRPGVSLPLALLTSPELEKGMKELDNFGFRTSTAQIDPAGLMLVSGKYKKASGFHVSDLWSQRLQQEFLKKLRLERAQYARERQVSFLNYLIENRKKLMKPLEPELLVKNYVDFAQNKIKRGVMVRKAAYELGTKSKSEINLPNFSPMKSDRPACTLSEAKEVRSRQRISTMESFIDHCSSTLQSFRSSKKTLVQSAASLKPFGAATARATTGGLATERPWLQGSPEKKHRSRSIVRAH